VLLIACGVPQGEDVNRGGEHGTSRALTFAPEMGLVGYWNFDAQATQTADSSGKSPSAQISKATWTASGRSAGALYFNGTDAVVTIPDGGWNKGNPITYNLWFKSDGALKGHLLEHEFPTTSAGGFAIDAGRANFRSYDASRKVRDQPFGTLPAGAWTMLTVVIDGGTIRLYKNGTQVGTVSRTLSKRAGALHVGATGPRASPFLGWIDELSVFGRALTDAQISNVYAMYEEPPTGDPSEGGDTALDSTLLAHWPFDDGTAKDVSGNHNDGAITGAVPSNDGRFGKALYFDGKSYVTIPDGSWNRSAPITYNVWFKPEGEAAGFVLDHHEGWQSPGAFGVRADKGVTFLAFDGAGHQVEFAGDPAPPNTWFMFTTVFTDSEVRLYRNGALWKRIDKLGLPRSEGEMYLAASDQAKWGFFTGWIDDVSVYGRALTDAEIQTLSTTSDACPTDPGKLLPGACGCNVPDTDSNKDGVLDCKVECYSEVINSFAGHLRKLQCDDPSRSPCRLRVQAKANNDRQVGARLYMAKIYNPGEQLALSRDRMRKMMRAKFDAAFLQAICDGDDDGDMIPNPSDNCPGTREYRPTDDHGCEVTELPPTAPRAAIDELLGAAGIVYDRRCRNANRPATPKVLSIVHYARDPARYGIEVTPVQNQPAGCPLQYQIKATLTYETELTSNIFTQRFVTLTYLTEGDARVTHRTSSDLLNVDNRRSGDEQLWPLNVSRVDISIQAMNGNGQFSGWSPSQQLGVGPDLGPLP
jgi:hypothetical protein